VPATGNAQLVARLAQVARAIEREPATVDQARDLLGLTTNNASEVPT
jgi:uncharacterized protein (DUF849 family)